MDPVWALSAGDLRAAYASGATDPVAVLQAIEERIDALNPALNAIIARDPHRFAAARESAERLRRGAARGPLWERLGRYYNGWSHYQTLTDRHIPAVVLRPR